MKRRVVSLLLALVMALGLCVTTAWAEDVTELTMANLNDYYTKESDGSETYNLTEGAYKLGGDITLHFPIEIFGTVTLDLNGHAIRQDAEYDTLILAADAAFTLTDSVGNGKIYEFLSDVHSILYSVKLNKNSSFYMQGGTVETIALTKDNATMYADGGTVTGQVDIKATGCTITTSGSVTCTTFESFVVNKKGTVSGGTFNGQVSNDSTISDGTFNGTVINSVGTIKGGTFYGTVTNMKGTIADSAYVTVTFNDTDISPEKVLKGQRVAKPDDPTRKGHTFGGWYTDADCTAGNKYSFDTSVTANLTLYAKWTKDTPEVTPTPAPSRPTTATTTTDTVSSPKTGDPGVLLTGALSVASLLGMGYIGKKW